MCIPFRFPYRAGFQRFFASSGLAVRDLGALVRLFSSGFVKLDSLGCLLRVGCLFSFGSPFLLLGFSSALG